MLKVCPSGSELSRFAVGQLGDDELAAIGEHLDTCAHCRAVVDAIPDPFASHSLPVVIGPIVADSVLRRAFELVHLIPPPSGEDALPEPPPPTHFGRFRVVGRLGGGAMGVVYEAEDERLGRRVAVKVLRAAFAARPGARDRFLREARATATVRHPNVVAILEVGEVESGPYLVMELLAGESLGARLRRSGPLPVADAVRVGREVAAGLAAAHARGLIHRDVTPDNIWLTADGPARLLDFGLVRADDGAATAPGTIVGTPRYMPPEQARAGAVDHRADVFGLGAALYHVVTGVPPFPGTDTLAILSALATHTPAPADRVNPAVPKKLAKLLARMTAKNPDDRPPGADAVVAELAEALVPPPRRWRWLVPPLLLALLAGAVWLATRPGPEPPADADPLPVAQLPAPAPAPRAESRLPVAPPPRPVEELPDDPDRAATEWALSSEAFAKVIVARGEAQTDLCTQHRTGEARGFYDRRGELPKEPYQLVHLNLNRHARLNDSHTHHLRGLRHLTFLQLSNSRITDATLPHLKHCEKLETLLIYATGVTDDGLKHLEGLHTLRELNLRQTRVTDIGLRKLSAALPRCRIEWNGGIIGPIQTEPKP